MIAKYHWLGAIALALSLHVAAFVTLPSLVEKSASKDKGETGIEIDLGMLGDLGIAMTETAEEKFEEPIEPEPVKETPITEPAKEVEVQKEPEPIIKPLKVKQKNIVQKEVVKIKKQTAKPKKIKKIAEPSPTKVEPRKEVSRPVETTPLKTVSTNDNKAKQSNTDAKKITTGTENALSTGGQTAAKQSYLSVLAAKLARHKRYPNSSRKRQQEGTVTLTFVVTPDGKVKESYISESSGYPKLDSAVLRMLKKASPLPPFTSDMEQEQMTIRIPIEFKLNDKH